MTVQIKDKLSAAAKRDLEKIVAAAEKGERCPQALPHGPLQRDTVRELVEAGLIRSEVYAHGYRVVEVLATGRRTAPAPAGRRPYMIDGKRTKP